MNKVSRRKLAASALSAATLTALSTASTANAQTQKISEGETPKLTPYLLFDGNCREAMQFYQSCFGGELTVTAVKDSAAKDFIPPAQHEKTVNARLASSNLEISASDWLRPGHTPVRGNTVCLYLKTATLQELQTLFGKLSQGAEVSDPLATQFFGTYGALNDKFGVRWMFQTDKKA
jgi:PhnB protein